MWNPSRFMLRRTIARLDATSPDSSTFTARPAGVIPLNLRERRHPRMGNRHSLGNFSARCPVAMLSYVALGRPPSHFGQVNYLLGHKDLSTRYAVFLYQTGLACRARCLIFPLDQTRFLAVGVQLSAQPRSTSLTGFANGKFKNVKTRDGRKGYRRFWEPRVPTSTRYA